MLIESILTPERCKANIEGGSKKRVIETLAKIFADNIENFKVDDVYQSLINREKLGSTGLGGGIAIPHCRFETQGETYGVCVTLNHPIDFDAVDSKPVDIIFAMLVPENAEKSHLEFLASLAEVMQNQSFVERLRATNTDEDLYKVITQKTG